MNYSHYLAVSLQTHLLCTKLFSLLLTLQGVQDTIVCQSTVIYCIYWEVVGGVVRSELLVVMWSTHHRVHLTFCVHKVNLFFSPAALNKCVEDELFVSHCCYATKTSINNYQSSDFDTLSPLMDSTVNPRVQIVLTWAYVYLHLYDYLYPK